MFVLYIFSAPRNLSPEKNTSIQIHEMSVCLYHSSYRQTDILHVFHKQISGLQKTTQIAVFFQHSVYQTLLIAETEHCSTFFNCRSSVFCVWKAGNKFWRITPVEQSTCTAGTVSCFTNSSPALYGSPPVAQSIPLSQSTVRHMARISPWLSWTQSQGGDVPLLPSRSPSAGEFTKSPQPSVLKRQGLQSRRQTRRRYKALSSGSISVSVKRPLHSQLNWAILLCDVIPDGKTE